jgi:hypothetical protein
MRIDLSDGLIDREAIRHLRQLVRTTGEEPWRRLLARRAARPSLSPNNFYYAYIDSRNPFVEMIGRFLDLESSASALWRQLNPGDHRLLSRLYVANRVIGHYGSPLVTNKMVGTLTSEDCRGLLLELDTATHFFRLGYSVEFMDLTGQASYDLLITQDNQALEVECKRNSADVGRPIKRADFRLLADVMVARLGRVGARALIRFRCEGQLGSNQEAFTRVADEIRGVVERREPEYGGVPLGAQIEYLPAEVRLYSEADARVFATSRSLTNSELLVMADESGTVVVACESARKSEMLEAIHRDLKAAASQCSMLRPAMLFCLIEDVDDAAWDLLKDTSGLKTNTRRLFSKPARSHVKWVAYTSDQTPVRRVGNVVEQTSGALWWSNPQCTHPLPDSFHGLNVVP